MYEAETSGVRIRVEPAYLDHESTPTENRYVWAYTIDIENHRTGAVRLVHRHWRITDANGFTQEVQGPGVVGEQPVIEPNSAYSYTSACPLGSASGMMVGAYDMIDLENGSRFQVDIPAFALDSPYSRRLAN
ncbi:MAG: Co2+/Mg2+ efflux protein ApaG [Hyphomonadaceae bacterium]